MSLPTVSRALRLGAVAACVAGAGCAGTAGSFGSPSPGTGLPTKSRGPRVTSSPVGRDARVATRKEVATKEEPATLVATDGSRCEPGKRRYDRARVHDRVSCLWADPAPR